MVPQGVNDPPRDRDLILNALARSERGDAYVADALRDAFERTHFPFQRRRLVVATASGVVRRRLTLDHVIARVSTTPLSRLNPALLDILRLATFEIVFLQEVPVHASVDEAVEMTKRRVKPRAAGFANAVLRKIARSIEKTVRFQGRFRPSARELQVAPGRAVRFHEAVFPDPQADAVGYLSVAGGMPRWLVDRWIARFGLEKARQVVEASNGEGRLALRANLLRTSVEKLQAELGESDIRTCPGPVPGSLVVEGPAALSNLDAFHQGRFYIQDVSSMRAPLVLGPRPGEKILDLCAAPGGKTTHIAELTGDTARIFALDNSERRILRVEENARRLGIRGIVTAVGDAREAPDSLRGTFDAVLADVPCSNTGVLRRRAEARHRLTAQALVQLTEVQSKVLEAAIVASRPGGRVVYSTCSIEAEEDGEMVRRVLQTHDGWRLDYEELILPEPAGPDGAYVARLVSEESPTCKDWRVS